MFTQEIVVTYRDGREATVVTDQGHMAEFELWAMRRGLKAPSADVSLMQALPLTFIRFAAWAATFQGNQPRPDYDIWTTEVIQVAPSDMEEPDPTQATTPVA